MDRLRRGNAPGRVPRSGKGFTENGRHHAQHQKTRSATQGITTAKDGRGQTNKTAEKQGIRKARTDNKMALLDWMTKDRPATQQQTVAKTSQEQKLQIAPPKNAQEMYARETAQENANRRPVEQLPDATNQQALEAAHPAAQLMDKATSHQTKSHDTSSTQSDSREALMHNQSAKGKTQEPLSPTDSHKGHTRSQAKSRGRGMER
jgi:hypothetical protein